MSSRRTLIWRLATLRRAQARLCYINEQEGQAVPHLGLGAFLLPEHPEPVPACPSSVEDRSDWRPLMVLRGAA
jgi:hypothetical protein